MLLVYLRWYGTSFFSTRMIGYGLKKSFGGEYGFIFEVLCYLTSFILVRALVLMGTGVGWKAVPDFSFSFHIIMMLLCGLTSLLSPLPISFSGGGLSLLSAFLSSVT